MDIIGGSYIFITSGSLRVNVDLMLLSNISNMRGRNNERIHYQTFQEFKSSRVLTLLPEEDFCIQMEELSHQSWIELQASGELSLCHGM